MDNWTKIKHLYHRAGFGLSLEEALNKKKSNIQKEINTIFKAQQNSKIKTPEGFTALQRNIQSASDMRDKGKRREIELQARKLTPKIVEDWILLMARTENPLLEKMSLFWHGHFACRTRMPHLASLQLNTIREHALGNFKDLTLAIAKDPSMIRYLNNQQNNKRSPNENFARELLELFTIGIGNYTEKDIKEAGRAFTGWKSDVLKGKFVFNEKQHDFGEKTFMGKKGNFNGEDIIDIIFEQKQTAQFIASKVYKYFVNPQPNPSLINELADVFYSSNYDIKKMMKHLFSSSWFYHKINMGVKIKSPVELIVEMTKSLQLEYPNFTPIMNVQRQLGQIIFNPPNVAGWAGNKAWIDNATLLTRLNLPALLLMSKNVFLKNNENKKGKKFLDKFKVEVDINCYYKEFKNSSKTEIRDELISYCINVPLSVSKDIITRGVEGKTQEEIIQKMIYKVMSLPEYQLC